ncbi:putative LRR receptor-like serine/threonine-protein [Sesbania bispinosa]|nr:putative LRR receptor-like serine/threonine-protein [Sesbania bispinosa]
MLSNNNISGSIQPALSQSHKPHTVASKLEGGIPSALGDCRSLEASTYRQQNQWRDAKRNFLVRFE